jgi:hypothetical protein
MAPAANPAAEFKTVHPVLPGPMPGRRPKAGAVTYQKGRHRQLLIFLSNSHFGAGAACGTPASAGSPHEFRGRCRLKAAFRGLALGCTLQNENC